MLEFIKSLARQAGELARHKRAAAGGVKSSFKYGHELVTEADVAVETLICERIRARYPGHAILAEESAPDLATAGALEQPLWIIDPIDGTVNYAHDHYQVAVCIAYAEQGDILRAVVYNPFLDELYFAERGQGAWLVQGGGAPQRLAVAEKRDLRRCLFATGFPYHKDDLAPLLRRLAVAIEHCADLRRIGSAAMDICWVAAGRLDIYYESLSIWDFAAAQLIAREAGARFGHFLPVPEGVNPVFHNKHLLVANPALFEQMQALLRSVEEEGDAAAQAS